MKCNKCNSKVIESKFSNFNGYKTYKCTNTSCNHLMDEAELNLESEDKQESSLNELLAPDFSNKDFLFYFNVLNQTRYTNIDKNLNFNLFFGEILNKNKNAIGLFSNSHNRDKTLREMINKKVFTENFFTFRSNISFFLKQWDYFIFDKLDKNQAMQLNNLVTRKNINNRVYIIEQM